MVHTQAALLEDMKLIIGKLSQLRSEMLTNKTLRPLEISSSHLEDCIKWNRDITQGKDTNAPYWFSSPWLLVECYMYRAIYSMFENRYVCWLFALKVFDITAYYLFVVPKHLHEDA